MRVTIVNETLPYPPNAGNRIRTLNLMLRLSGEHRITYICRGAETAQAIRDATQYLRDHGIETIVAEGILPAKSGLRYYARAAGNLFSSRPFAVASHDSDAVRAAMRRHAQAHPVDLWQFEWLAYADSFRHLNGAASIIMAHNVESLIWQRYADNEHAALRRWYLRGQRRKFERFEAGVLRQATRVVAVSRPDARLMRHHFGVRRVSVVDNGIDPNYFISADEPPRDPTRILFLGSLDWRPNLDALNLLLTQIFPLVLREEAAARLCIVGRHPPQELRRRVNDSRNVELHADAPDARPFLRRCAVMAVPLRIGGGSRLKILEALACAMPVVSSSIGYEGLELQPRQQIRVADDPEPFAHALLWCMRQPEAAGQMARRGQHWVLRRYDWDVLARRLDTIWRRCTRSHDRGSSDNLAVFRRT